eukprot:GILK01009071.1.p1 GENE.GILK01009071.1~~GILK01009071.1.p1  ORF type:complete len:1605 (-),score=326.59 GILK01009071.1:77-4891(-)
MASAPPSDDEDDSSSPMDFFRRKSNAHADPHAASAAGSASERKNSVPAVTVLQPPPTPSAPHKGGGMFGGITQMGAKVTTTVVDNLILSAEDALEAQRPTAEVKNGDYRIQVHVLEARDLQSQKGLLQTLASNKGDSADPVCEVKIFDKKKTTKIEQKTLNPNWDQTFTFNFTNLTVSDIETGRCTFTVYDANTLLRNDPIGSFEIDLAYIYQDFENHEMFRQWVALTDTTDEREGSQGFLLISLAVLGPGDELVAHTEDEIKAKKAPKMTDGPQSLVLTPPSIVQTGHSLELTFYKGVDFPRMDDVGIIKLGSCDPYLTVQFAGCLGQTSIVYNTLTPSWNELIRVPVMLPAMAQKIEITAWDHDSTSSDDKISTFRINFREIMNQQWGPRWVSLYGPPLNVTGPYTTLMTKYPHLASQYMGRLLMSATSHNEDQPKLSTVKLETLVKERAKAATKASKTLAGRLGLNKDGNQDLPTSVLVPEIPETEYTLRVDIFEGCELPDKGDVYIEVTVGPYSVKTLAKNSGKGRVLYYQALQDVHMLWPTDKSQIPDIFIYLCKGSGKHARICYARFPPSRFWGFGAAAAAPEWHPLAEDKAIDALANGEFPGFVLARICFGPSSECNSRRPDLLIPEMFQYELRAHIYSARDLPPADSDGAADPYVVVRCAGEYQKTVTKRTTLHPQYYQTVSMVVKLPLRQAPPPWERSSFYSANDEPVTADMPEDRRRRLVNRHKFMPNDGLEIPSPGINLLVFDEDSFGKHDFIGRCWVDAREVGDVMPDRPTWYELAYQDQDHDEVKGAVLASLQLLPIEKAKHEVIPPLMPPSEDAVLELTCLGLRDILQVEGRTPYRVYVEFKICDDRQQAVMTKKRRVLANSLNILEVLKMPIQLPTDGLYCPTVTAYIWDEPRFGAKRLLGVANIPLGEFVDKMEDRAVIAPVEYEAGGTDLVNENERDGNDDASQSFVVNNLRQALGPKNKLRQALGRAGAMRDAAAGTGLNGKAAGDSPASAQGSSRNWHAIKASVKTGPGLMVQSHQDIELVPKPAHKDSKWTKVKGAAVKVGTVAAKTAYNTGKGVVKGTVAVTKTGIHALTGKEKEKTDKSATATKDKDNGEGTGAPAATAVPGATAVVQEEEDLDDTPEWAKNRPVIDDELEDSDVIEKPFRVYDVQRGQTRGSTLFGKTKSTLTTVAQLKLLVRLQTQTKQSSEISNFRDLLQPRNYVCRVYITKGIQLTPLDNDGTSDPYLVLKLGDKVIKDNKKSKRDSTNEPDFFLSYDLPCVIPGSAMLKIKVMDYDAILDELIGETSVDLENLWFSPDWHALDKKPLENRSLYSECSKAAQGKLQMWVEILRPKEAVAQKPLRIAPPPQEPWELRVIVWDTKQVKYKDALSKMNDLYARGTFKAAGAKDLETDTHWRCQKGTGSFNWRWKIPIMLPLKKAHNASVFKLSLWDRDIVTANEMICEGLIDLDRFGMLRRGYKTKQPQKLENPTQAKDKEKVWFKLFHPETKDKLQGQIRMSFEILPKATADLRKNGEGRSEPNNYPVLPEPFGRFKWNFLDPLGMLKQIFGPELVNKVIMFICCILCVGFCLYFGSLIAGNVIGTTIAT